MHIKIDGIPVLPTYYSNILPLEPHDYIYIYNNNLHLMLIFQA